MLLSFDLVMTKELRLLARLDAFWSGTTLSDRISKMSKDAQMFVSGKKKKITASVGTAKVYVEETFVEAAEIIFR